MEYWKPKHIETGLSKAPNSMLGNLKIEGEKVISLNKENNISTMFSINSETDGGAE